MSSIRLGLMMPKIRIFILVCITLITTGRGAGVEGFVSGCYDDTTHAMNGVFIYDLLHDRPTTGLQDYAWQYYAQYPNLSLVYYPPFFHFVEAIFYLLFGIYLSTAKLVVLMFALVAVLAWYQLINYAYDETTAFYSSLLFATTPIIVNCSRGVLPELPALSLMIISVYFFHRFIEGSQKKYAYYWSLFTAMSVLTKHTSIFIVDAFLLFLTLKRGFMYLLREFKGPVVLFFLLTLPSSLLTAIFIKSHIIGAINLFEGSALAEATGHEDIGDVMSYGLSRFSAYYWLYHIGSLPQALGWPVFITGLLAIALGVYRGKDMGKILLLWVLTGYIFISSISFDTLRCVAFIVPPFTVFSVMFISQLKLPRVRNVPIAAVLLASISTFQFINACRSEPAYNLGYEEAARYIVQHAKTKRVLYTDYAGDFVFNIRKYDTQKAFHILRLDKLATTFNVEEVERVAYDYGVEYVVVESDPNHPENTLWKEILSSSKFTLEQTLPVYKGEQKRALNIYRYTLSPVIRKHYVELPVPRLGQGYKISVSIN